MCLVFPHYNLIVGRSIQIGVKRNKDETTAVRHHINSVPRFISVHLYTSVGLLVMASNWTKIGMGPTYHFSSHTHTHTHTHICICKKKFRCRSKERKRKCFKMNRFTKRSLSFFRIYLYCSYTRVCFQLVAFVREHMWHKAMRIVHLMRLELTLVCLLGKYFH